jgi:hypothetical protein
MCYAFIGTVGKLQIFYTCFASSILKIASFSCLIIDYKWFRGHFSLIHFSVNDSCYGSDGRSPLHSNLYRYTVKKSTQFYNLTLHILLNLQEKFYPSTGIHFGARCEFDHNRGTGFGHLVLKEDYFYSLMLFLLSRHYRSRNR